ncbi:MAG: hypothetical protein AAFQ98_08465, partial [Bacteroidota bacterium]
MRILPVLLCLFSATTEQVYAQKSNAWLASQMTEKEIPIPDESEVTIVAAEPSSFNYPRLAYPDPTNGKKTFPTFRKEPMKMRSGISWGLRMDIGHPVGLTIDPQGGPQLLELGRADESLGFTVDSQGNEIIGFLAQGMTINAGSNLTIRFKNRWGTQVGFDLGQVTYLLTNTQPFWSSPLVGDIASWEQVYMQYATHLGIDRYFRGPFQQDIFHMRLGLRTEWRRNTPPTVPSGTAEWLTGDTGAVWETTFTKGPTFVVAPEIGWRIDENYLLSLVYNYPLGKQATQTYTQYNNGEVTGVNQLSMNSELLAVRIQWDLLNVFGDEMDNPRRRPRIVTPSPAPEPSTEGEEPNITFDCNQTEAYVLQQVHFQ